MKTGVDDVASRWKKYSATVSIRDDRARTMSLEEEMTAVEIAPPKLRSRRRRGAGVVLALWMNGGCAGPSPAASTAPTTGPSDGSADEDARASTAPAPAVGLSESIRPGVNDRYGEADALETYREIFERERREVVAFRGPIVEALGLESGDVVADIGAGTGLFTFALSQAVEGAGRVYAVDIAPPFLEHLRAEVDARSATNVTVHEATPRALGLAPRSLDRALMSNVYHHVEYPFAYMPTVAEALRDEGRLLLIDFERIEGETSPRMLAHVRAGKATVIDELERAGLEVVEELELGLEENYALLLQPAR